MFEQKKYKSILKKINELITIEEFKNILNNLIKKMNNNCQYKLSLKRDGTGYIIWSYRENNEDYDLKVIINKNSIQFAYNSGNQYDNQYGEFFRSKHNTVSKLFNYTMTNNNINEIKTKGTISIFTSDLIEIFRYDLFDHQEYKIENGEIIYSSDDLAFFNETKTIKRIRTRENNLIQIEEEQFYDDKRKYKNHITYSIGKHIGPNSSKLPNVDHYETIPKEKYLDYVNGKINDYELLKNYKVLRKSGVTF